MQKFHLTQTSLDKFKQELIDLKQQLEEVIKLVASAREQGDLSENSEYQSAKSEQDMINSRITELENIFKNYILIPDDRKNEATIADLGSEVSIENVLTSEQITYKLVGTYEVDPFNNKISLHSNVGRILSGKTKGDQIIIDTSEGIDTYKIISIK